MIQKAKIMLLATVFSSGLTTFAQTSDVSVMTGTYQPTWESLSQWDCPEWFKDAKFGIWAHWGPQCYAEDGDWYARGMYYPGGQQNWHKSHFGDPGIYGFKEMCRDWKAQNWNPEALVDLYYSVGARYFMTLGNHHDNFDLWDSPYQQWNSVKIGPQRDIVGEWSQACKKHGLPLGVSMHASHAWTWMEPSQWYDGNLTTADGEGTWWGKLGLDPQELYAQRHTHSTGWESSGTIHSQWEWGNGASLPSEAYKRKFQNRVLQCVNDYKPDMLYFDDTVLPFWGCDESVGLNILSHFYNKNTEWHGGENKAVVCGKILPEVQKEAMLWDVERGTPDRPQAKYWQTCSCIGSWHYDINVYNNNGYKSAQQVIDMLIDIVSKNGNLLLSVPIRGDGTIDDKERAILNGIKAWMDINSTSIYGTRPWKTFGEGPLAESTYGMSAQGFNESNNYSAADVRYVTRNDSLFATIMRWPSTAQFTFEALGLASEFYSGSVNSVKLLGYGDVSFKQDINGLTIDMPETHPNEICPAFVITFDPESETNRSLSSMVDIYEQLIKQTLPLANYNTGHYSKTALDTFQLRVETAKGMISADDDIQKSEITKLNHAYTEYRSKSYNEGGAPLSLSNEDLTTKKLTQATGFSATNMGSRFGKPVNWTVENFNIPEKNIAMGTKGGIDKYSGQNCLMLGTWRSEDGTPNGDITNARIYRRIHLDKGRYYFGAAYNANYNMNGQHYIFVANNVLSTNAIPSKSIAYEVIGKAGSDGQMRGVFFTIEKPQDVVLGFQANLDNGIENQEFRAQEVRLLSYGNTVAVVEDLTSELLIESKNFSRKNTAETTRFSTPANWVVENFKIPNGADGTKNGIDKYPGYNCLMLGIWNDRASNTEGDLANARIYRTLRLSPGTYRFDAQFQTTYNISNAYIFASNSLMSTAQLPNDALGTYRIQSIPDRDANTWFGTQFTIGEEQDVIVGFQANLATGNEAQEFRVKSVNLSSLKLLDLDDTSTKIQVNPYSNHSLSSSDYVYDINGRKLNSKQHTQRGIHIMNGKKIIMK